MEGNTQVHFKMIRKVVTGNSFIRIACSIRVTFRMISGMG